MENKEEIERTLHDLTHAHRALAARSEAAFLTVKVLVALMPTPLPIMTRLLRGVHLATQENMQALGWDEDFQQQIKEALDELQSAAHAAERVGVKWGGSRPC